MKTTLKKWEKNDDDINKQVRGTTRCVMKSMRYINLNYMQI
jgi:hypothetical protein